MVHSVPELICHAARLGFGGHRFCFFCGAKCGEGNTTVEHLKDSFTGWSSVARPASKYVCDGCVWCMRDTAEIHKIDGTSAIISRAAVRAFSWIVTMESALAASKSHFAELRQACLNGLPSDAWAIVLSDSGQKHLLYRGAVNQGGSEWTVTLEEEPITYRSEQLASRLELCKKLAAVRGKPSLAEPIDANFAIAVASHFRDGDSLLQEWSKVWGQPLSRLAAWLTPRKDECLELYPSERQSD